MNEKLFQKNLELWSKTHPREAVLLQYLDCSNLKICQASDGLLNLRKEGELFYSTGQPIEESLRWFNSLDLSGVEVLYIYGMGLGYHYEILKSWLKKDPNHHVVFLEDDLEVIAKFFETKMASNLLKDTQTSLYFFKEIADSEFIFNQLFWNFPMVKFEVSALEYYQKTKASRFEKLSHQLSYDAALKTSLVQEYLEYGIAFFRNFYENIFQIGEAFLGSALFGKFQNVPAIICGAGPSLQKNSALLKTLRNKALIFAGSSALNALDSEGIQPDLGAGIDPNPMQENRLKKIANLNFPFFYRGRLYPGALKCVTGPKLYIPGAGGYDIAEFFEEKFEIEGKFMEEGRNVVNFCLELAAEMGCNPIIFIGMDLAFSEKKAYAKGIVEDVSILEPDDSLVEGKDIFGNPISTMWKWVSEAKWIGDFARNHPEMTLINATEGGLGFPDVPNRTLKNTIEEYITKEQDIRVRLNSLIESHPLSYISQEKIVETCQLLKKSLENCVESLGVLREENEKILKGLQTDEEISTSQSGLAAVVEMELAEEPAFRAILQVFNEVAGKLMQRDLMRLFDPHNTASEKEKELEKLNLNKQKYDFLLRVAQVNLEILKSCQKI